VLTPRATQLYGVGLFLFTIVGGIVLTWRVGSGLLMIGVLGMLIGWAYSAAPLRLNSRGLGEIAVALAFILVVAGADFVQRGSFSATPAWAGIGYALLTTNILYINQFPDREADIAAGKTMSDAPLPAWVFARGDAGVHAADGSYAPSIDGLRPRSSLPVYQRQYFPDAIYTESFDQGTTIFETDGVRLWHQGDDIAILSFKSKMNTIGASVLEGVNRAIDEAERNWKALVIWQTREPFSAGADLKDALPVVAAGKWDEFEQIVASFQAASQRIKYSLVPVVSAVRGMAFGGGCEFQMHSAKTVFALESYVGLVEAGVGLQPAGGGLKEFALRCAQAAIGGDVFGQIQTVFETIAMAKVATSAHEAKELKLARPGDLIIANKDELLYVAKNEARAMAESGYRPPLPPRAIRVAGDVGIATIRALLTNMQAGGFVSEHDVEVATRIATVLCGGEVERGSEVDEEWLLTLERKHFVALAQMPKTQARIAYTMQNGKPLRN